MSRGDGVLGEEMRRRLLGSFKGRVERKGMVLYCFWRRCMEKLECSVVVDGSMVW